MKNKKAAMEMSMGTIVTIVLLMSVLVLGIFFVQKIFKSSTSALDLTDQQLQSEIGKLFAEDTKVAIYPSSRQIKIKVGERGAIGLGIKNVANNVNDPTDFSYEVAPRGNDCGLNDEQSMSFIGIGESENNIPIAMGDLESARVEFKIPEGTPNCLVSYRANVMRGGINYDSELFNIEIKA